MVYAVNGIQVSWIHSKITGMYLENIHSFCKESEMICSELQNIMHL